MGVNKERTISQASGVKIPDEVVVPIDIIFKECCYDNTVLASTTLSGDNYNDFTGFYHTYQTSNDNPEFVLIDLGDLQEYDLDDSTYGEFNSFDSLDTYVISWNKVISTLGTGSYKVVKRYTLAGISIEEEYLIYNLKEYSQRRANGTIRIDSFFNGYFEETKTSFKDTNFKTSVRVEGFFGNRDFDYEIDNLVNKDYVKRQVSVTHTNEYKMQINSVPSCISKEVIDFMLMSDSIKVTDYNLNNHSYDYILFEVAYLGNDGTNYNSQTRKTQLNLTFTDEKSNKIKRY